MALPLMPKATAVWLVDNTALTFEQIADFCGLHKLEVQAIADGEVAVSIVGLDPVFTILTGGVVFSAFFMATDYVTRPLTPLGQVLYGVGIGLIIVIIREFGGYPEGVTYAILIMNIITPYLNKLKTKKYGYVAPPKPVKAVKGASK